MNFLILCLVTLLSPGEGVGIKLSIPLISLVEEHDATMQPHFDRSVFQNLNFPVFDEAENGQFPIFRFLGKKKLCCSNNHFHKELYQFGFRERK